MTLRARSRRLGAWWREAGSAAQLGAVVGVLTALIGGVCAAAQLLGGEDPPAPAASGPATPRLEYAVTLPARENHCTSSWIVPRDVADGTPFDPREVPADGVLGSGSAIEIVAQETTGRTVVLHGLRAEVRSRGPAAPGSRLTHGGCGGTLQQALLRIDLATQAGVAVPRDPAAAAPFPWTVAEHDPAAYSVKIEGTGRVEFVLVLDWSWGGRREQTIIDDAGRPFVVSSAEQATDMCSFQQTWRGGRCE